MSQSTNITSGGVYQIITRYHDGGFVSVGGEGTQALILSNATNDTSDSDKWILRATGSSGMFLIESVKYPSTFASENSTLDLVFQEPTETPTPWYIAQASGVDPVRDQDFTFHICRDSTCDSYWVPASYDVDAPSPGESGVQPLPSESGVPPLPSGSDVPLPSESGPDDQDRISLRDQSFEGEGFELWRIKPVETAPSSPPETTPLPETPSSISSLISVATVTDLPSSPSPTVGNEGEQDILCKCPPNGTDHCSFTPLGRQTVATYLVLIGQPVYNCVLGHNQSTKTTIGGTFELERSWSVEVQTQHGFGLIGPVIKTTAGFEERTRESRTQLFEVNIPPGLIGALVANISYTRQPGQATVGKEQLLLVAVEPEFVLGYAVVYANCSSDFHADALPPKIQCSGATRLLKESLFFTKQGIAFWILALTLLVLSA